MAKRRRAAPGGRALATGVGVSATLGIMGALATEAPPAPATEAPAPVSSASPVTTIVTRVVPRTIYVDAGSGGTRSGSASSGPSASSGRGSGPSVPAPAPPTPTCSGSKC